MLFYEKKETDQELLFFFIRPYLVLVIIFYIFFTGSLRFLFCGWWIWYLPTPGSILMLWFMIETLLVVKNVFTYGKHNASRSGKVFSRYNPMTLIIKKG